MLSVTRNAAHSGFDGVKCLVHARAGLTSRGSYVMTAQRLLLAGSDIFDPPMTATSEDGARWSGFSPDPAFAERFDGTVGYTVCDFTPSFHAATGKLLGTGAEIGYDTACSPKRIVASYKATAYAVWDEAAGRFHPRKLLEVPDPRFVSSRAGSTQRYDCADGGILLPVYYSSPDTAAMGSIVFRCSFDGETLTVTDVGDPVRGEEDARGLYEPSVSALPFGGYLLTLRSDRSGWRAFSPDGLHCDAPEEWRWQDGEVIGNYNTQQHFLRLCGKLYLVYTRRGLDNDHVFRHRAPLMLAEIEPRSLRLVRSTETVAVPQRGARLGNFAVTQISEDEALITAAEWMQPVGCEKYGSDNTVWTVRIHG